MGAIMKYIAMYFGINLLGKIGESIFVAPRQTAAQERMLTLQSSHALALKEAEAKALKEAYEISSEARLKGEEKGFERNKELFQLNAVLQRDLNRLLRESKSEEIQAQKEMSRTAAIAGIGGQMLASRPPEPVIATPPF